MCPERSRKQFSSLCRSCEARASLFKSQAKSIKQFSALCMCCEARASLFKCEKRLTKPCEGAMRLMQACLNARKV